MIVGMNVPHQTTADSSHYAVSAKVATKDDHISNDDANKQQEIQEVCMYPVLMIRTEMSWHSLSLINSVTSPLLMYSKFFWPNLIWSNRCLIWWEHVW